MTETSDRQSSPLTTRLRNCVRALLRIGATAEERGAPAASQPNASQQLLPVAEDQSFTLERIAAALEQLTVGFQRLDRDLVTLASTSREHTALLARLVVSDQDTTEILREYACTLPQQVSAVLPVAHPTAVVAPLSEVRVAPTLLSHPNLRALLADSPLPWCISPELLPKTDAALPRLLPIMASCRTVLRHPDRLLWIQPLPVGLSLTLQEMEQVLGIVAAVDRTVEVTTVEGQYLIAIGTMRHELVTTALRWSANALDELHHRARPLIEHRLRARGLAQGLHAVDLPDATYDFETWAATLPSLAALLRDVDDVPLGVVLPPDFQNCPALVVAAIDRLEAAFREAGVTRRLEFQWVRGPVQIGQSADILHFAQSHGIAFDLTAGSRSRPESRVVAYDDAMPYRPLGFDLRLPSIAPSSEFDVVEIPRWSGRNLRLRACGSLANLGALFDRDVAQACDRLAPVLDRSVRRQYEAQVNLDHTLMPYWPDYFVYNWAPPKPATMRVIEFDGIEIVADGSPLAGLPLSCAEDPRWMAGRAVLRAARDSVGASRMTERQLRLSQVDEHHYLRGREDITPDAARLIEWMPDRIGVALEIGSGYGVMARRVRHRASRYISCDLSISQGVALREVGTEALVADVHRLPLADASIDTIIADNVIEHAYDPLGALAECRRLLRPGGSAFLVIPNDYRDSAFSNRTHYWKADEESVRLALECTGLRVVRSETVQLTELGVSGAFPSSRGSTTLWHVEVPGGNA